MGPWKGKHPYDRWMDGLKQAEGEKNMIPCSLVTCSGGDENHKPYTSGSPDTEQRPSRAIHSWAR